MSNGPLLRFWLTLCESSCIYQKQGQVNWHSQQIFIDNSFLHILRITQSEPEPLLHQSLSDPYFASSWSSLLISEPNLHVSVEGGNLAQCSTEFERGLPLCRTLSQNF